MPTEKELDRALEAALRDRPEFALWFLSHTKFAGKRAAYVWSRADNPWSRETLTVSDPQTGEPQEITRDGETDLLVVFREDDSNARFALHIENKRIHGRFMPYQPEAYVNRAERWRGLERYGNYTEFETVLVAPRAIRTKYPRECAQFGCFVAHEDIVPYIGIFSLDGT